MKLTMTLVVALLLAGGSLVARAGILEARRVEAQPPPTVGSAEESERAALAGLDFRLQVRLRRLAGR